MVSADGGSAPRMLNRPTAKEIRAALVENAHPDGRGRWSFSGGYPHTEQAALDIVELCLILDGPITDVLSGSVLLRLTRAVADLQRQVDGGMTNGG